MGGGDGWGGMGGGGFPVKNLVWTMAGGGIGPLDPPPVHKNIRHLRGQTAHTTTTSLIRHQTSDLIHIADPYSGAHTFFFPSQFHCFHLILESKKFSF